ncbi:MAG: FMN-binding protein [Candidatus Marinimicrobia bacterium]|nr:FMN-binding protein [Candidatus Neomarinimicrobiota bacterium]
MKRTISLTFIVLFAVILLSSCKPFREYRQRVADVQLENIDLQQIRDGDYSGEYDAVIVKAEVLVKVRDHRITAIDLVRHDNGRGKAAEVLIDTVLARQSVVVDAISGATSSSMVILEAIESALKKGME